MNRSALRSLVRTYTQESSTVPLTDPMVNDLLAQGEERLADLAEYSAAKFTDVFATNDFDYELDSSMLSILSVAWNDVNGNLVPTEGPVSLRQMDDEFSSWRSDAADRPARWWLLGNALMVHPKPSATYNETPIEIYATIVPPAMGGDSSEPTDLPARFHRTLAKYATWKWLAIDKENPTAVRMAGFYRDEFAADAMRLRQLIWGRTQTDGAGLRIQRSRDDGAASAVDET